MIVTIDGPAGSGKSTVAKALAARLGFEYLDTGAMYRAVALALTRQAIDLGDLPAVEAAVPGLRVEMPPGRVLLNGEDVSNAIRSPEMSQGSSRVAVIRPVRRAMAAQQRTIAAGRNMVCEGRDQGTVVFPDAAVKFFLDADPEVRAERRYRELLARGTPAVLAEVLQDQIERDHRDRTRSDSPLLQPADAIVIDTSRLTPDEVLARMEEEVIRRCPTARA